MFAKGVPSTERTRPCMESNHVHVLQIVSGGVFTVYAIMRGHGNRVGEKKGREGGGGGDHVCESC